MTIKSRRAALEIILAKSKTILERESIVQVLEEGLTNEDWAIRDLSIDLTSKLFSLSPELFWNSKLPKLVIGLLQDKEVYIRKVGLGMLLRLLKTKKLPPLFVSELEKQAMDCISHADSLILADFIKVFNTGAMRHLITIAMFKSWLEHEQYDIRVEAIKVCISDLSEPYNSKLSKMLHLVKPLKTDLSRVVKLEFIELVELGLNQHTFKEFQNYCSTVDLEKLKLMTDLNELYNEEWYLNESVLDDSRGDDPLNCYDCYDC